MREKVNLYWKFAKGTTVKAQGTMALAVGTVKHMAPRQLLWVP